ncbi:MAG: multiheme c-type cytochrome [Opitutaceae bacterium]
MTAVSLLTTSWQTTPPANRPIQQVTPEYASADSCRSCHPGNYASWHASFHRTMTQVAKVENVASDMDGLKLSIHGTDYRVDRKGEAYYVRSKPAGSDDSAFGASREIVLLTGSHNLQIYWTATGVGRTLGQLPFAYVVAEKKWAPMEDTFLVPPGPSEVYQNGDWNIACYNCHVTQGRQRFVSAGKYDSEVTDFGISCEACHSGGREHIEKNRNPLRRFALHWTDHKDPTIANPARMDGPTASLVCGQCHSIWAFKNHQVELVWSKQGAQYRPGAKELDGRWVVQPTATDHPVERETLLKSDPHFMTERFWGDGMVRVTGRELNGVMASPCYKGGKFSCLSCHEMHPANTDPVSLKAWATTQQLKPEMTTNQSCLQCHAAFKAPAALAAHTHHGAESAGSNCYDCHMPHTTYGLLRAIRSHQISNPSVRESIELGRPNACNLCHLDKPLAWTAGKLAEWYGQKAPELSTDDHRLSAGVQWLLKGDAEQRMLVAWSMGWEPAQKASGREWLYPYLAFELNDPYAAVRFAAWKSLQTLPGFSGYDFDYTVGDAQQKEATAKAYQKWWFEQRNKEGGYRPETMLEPTGLFQQELFDRMLDQRNHRKVYLAE